MKVGDSVIVIDGDDRHIHNGDIGIITYISGDSDMYDIKWDPGSKSGKGGWMAERFKKYDRHITNWRERIK